ncbi:hypothetical protein MW290_01110 [Aquincola tertiaricarbonis]|uniref:SnoaL-like domain-containing protein n=1 Tax=Aquincola tertiaricarbonis TaxID=391953 RepID=A0ABY4S5U8_AQUTE|nr:hypothetical protein [Aquincola tertiaricarbonis]URI07256.1 hypothetical protein MW290_01110 [Aquincola tertiaricarbonis]
MKFPRSALGCIGLWMSLLGLLTGAAVAQPGATPDQVFDRYAQAVHAGDMAAVRALIAPDVERSDFVGCQPQMDNPTCLAHYIEQTVVVPKASFTDLGRVRRDDLLDVRLEVRSPLYTRAGVDRIVGRDLLQVRGGLIRSFRFIPDFQDPPTVRFFATLGIGPGAPAARPAASQP